LGVTLETNPLLAFTLMAVVNGFYVAAHNVYRGFPRAAVIGNLFRSVAAIPCALLYHLLLLALLRGLEAPTPELYLQLLAAIISKASSDTVAGLIESIADRQRRLRLRRMDYTDKIGQLVETYTQLELAYPREHILRLLARPENLLDLTKENLPLRVASIANALDLMYFWYYQPQAQQAIKRIVRRMTGEERLIFARSQFVLSQVREISQLFVDGLVGEQFPKALSFYLDRNSDYIRAMRALCFPGSVREEGQ